jgi:hypothetical protein
MCLLPHTPYSRATYAIWPTQDLRTNQFLVKVVLGRAVLAEALVRTN